MIQEQIPVQKLQIKPIRLRLRSPVRDHPKTNQTTIKTQQKSKTRIKLSVSVSLPRGEQSEDVKREHGTRGHGLLEKLPQRGPVVIEAEIGDESEP